MMEDGETLGEILDREAAKADIPVTVLGCELGVENQLTKEIWHFCITPEGEVRGNYLDGFRHYLGDAELWGHEKVLGRLMEPTFSRIKKGDLVTIRQLGYKADTKGNKIISFKLFRDESKDLETTGKVIDARIRYKIQTPHGWFID